MQALSFTTIVQAILAFVVVGVVCYLAVIRPDDFKDSIVQLAMLGFGFWLGSSRSSQAKDDKPKEVTQ